VAFDSEIDQLVYGLWKDLPSLSDDDIAARVSGFEGVRWLRPSERLSWIHRSWFPSFLRKRYGFLNMCLENVYQHVDYRVSSLAVEHSFEGNTSIYLLDSGLGFVDSDGEVILREAAEYRKGFGRFTDQGLGFSRAIWYSHEFWAFSVGHALYKGVGEGVSDVKYVPYPFDEKPAGALICGRFFGEYIVIL